MDLEERIDIFIKLHKRLACIPKETMENLVTQARNQNPWFTKENINSALQGILILLEEKNLQKWVAKYDLSTKTPKVVGIVMAGNIPLVGFHDLLAVLISGNIAAVKTSSQDQVLTNFIINELMAVGPALSKNISRRERLTEIDAVIATGSDNTSRYFEYYFSHVPNIIRKNRTSVAVITGKESEDEITGLGEDIYKYFGMGCRNVSKIYIPKDFDIRLFFPQWENFSDLANHHKYFNNYEYNKAIYLVNRVDHYDTGYSLWTNSDALVSPLSVTFYEPYNSEKQLNDLLESHDGKIQCVVASKKTGSVSFGQAQKPNLWDYPDNVDTLSFLQEL